VCARLYTFSPYNPRTTRPRERRFVLYGRSAEERCLRNVRDSTTTVLDREPTYVRCVGGYTSTVSTVTRLSGRSVLYFRGYRFDVVVFRCCFVVRSLLIGARRSTLSTDLAVLRIVCNVGRRVYTSALFVPNETVLPSERHERCFSPNGHASRTRLVPFRWPLSRAVIVPAVRTGAIIAFGVPRDTPAS